MLSHSLLPFQIFLRSVKAGIELRVAKLHLNFFPHCQRNWLESALSERYSIFFWYSVGKCSGSRFLCQIESFQVSQSWISCSLHSRCKLEICWWWNIFWYWWRYIKFEKVTRVLNKVALEMVLNIKQLIIFTRYYIKRFWKLSRCKTKALQKSKILSRYPEKSSLTKGHLMDHK